MKAINVLRVLNNSTSSIAVVIVATRVLICSQFTATEPVEQCELAKRGELDKTPSRLSSLYIHTSGSIYTSYDLAGLEYLPIPR
jgi:hypothetical protein